MAYVCTAYNFVPKATRPTTNLGVGGLVLNLMMNPITAVTVFFSSNPAIVFDIFQNAKTRKTVRDFWLSSNFVFLQ